MGVFVLVLSLINLSQYKTRLKEASSYFQDAALMEIPSDAVFVTYANQVKPHGIRLLSKSSLETSLRQNAEARTIVREGNHDNSGIMVAMRLAEDLPPREKLIKEALEKLIRRGLNIQQIISMERIAFFTILLQPDNFPLLNQMFEIDSPVADIANLIFCLMLQGGYPPFSLANFAMIMFQKQTAIVEENRQKLLQKDGSPLSENQIICPYTRETINVDFSQKNQKYAPDFIAVFIALSKLAKADEPSIDNFLDSQPRNYLANANQKLLDYLRKPAKFGFSKEQHQFLQEIGTAEAAKQLRFHEKLEPAYKDLWVEDDTVEGNVLRLLIDYSKKNWCLPSLGLFFTGHWNRHHHSIVNEAIESLQQGDRTLKQILDNLEKKAKTHPNFNAEGSLMCRLDYIRAKTDNLKEIPKFVNPGSRLGTNPIYLPDFV